MKYIALDIGNVCVKPNHAEVFGRFGVALDSPMVARFKEELRDFEFGRISGEAFFDRLAAMPETAGLSRQELRQTFDDLLAAPVEGMEKLFEEFPAMGICPAYMSDISTVHLKRSYDLFPRMADYTGIYSFDTGVYKPDIKMFQAYEARFGKPLLYTDDRADLIEAAQKYGWNAEVFTSAENLKNSLIHFLQTNKGE